MTRIGNFPGGGPGQGEARSSRDSDLQQTGQHYARANTRQANVKQKAAFDLRADARYEVAARAGAFARRFRGASGEESARDELHGCERVLAIAQGLGLPAPPLAAQSNAT